MGVISLGEKATDNEPVLIETPMRPRLSAALTIPDSRVGSLSGPPITPREWQVLAGSPVCAMICLYSEMQTSSFSVSTDWVCLKC